MTAEIIPIAGGDTVNGIIDKMDADYRDARAIMVSILDKDGTVHRGITQASHGDIAYMLLGLDEHVRELILRESQ